MGANISVRRNDREDLARYFLTARPPARARSVFKPGWDRNLFVFPDGTVIGTSTEKVAYQTTDPNNSTFKQSGNLADWKSQVAAHCEGNSRLILAVCAALTGPVLALLGEENGGFHFEGKSSSGKTTALFPACSVWGHPDHVINSWRATANGIEAKAVLHNDMVYALDEMSQVTPLEVGQVVYMLANGQGKVRSTQHSTAKTVSRWQLMFLSTGEVGLEEHIENGGGKVMAGQQTRLINIPADAGAGHFLFEDIHGHRDGAEFSLFLKTQSSTYHGSAGRAWVAALADMSQRTQILATIRDEIDTFANAHVPVGADGQVQRVGRRFGLVAAVGEACVRLGILPWSAGEAVTAMQGCLAEWITGRGGVGSLEADQALTQLKRFLETNGESRFTEISHFGEDTPANENRPTNYRVGFRKVAKDGHTDYYILPEAYKKDVCAGMNPRQFTQQLLAANALVLSRTGQAQVAKRLPGVRTVKVYHVRSTILGKEEPEED